MRKMWIIISAIAVILAGPALADTWSFIGGEGVRGPATESDPCPPSTLLQNHDGTTENAFTRGFAGVHDPDYGSFAEGYPNLTSGTVCGIELYLTCWGTMSGEGTIDLYVWSYDAATTNPGNVLSLTPFVPVSGVGFWPTVTLHDFDVVDAEAVTGGVFVGYWPRSFSWSIEQFGCAMDQNGFGGTPRTNIAPGIGYPTGWAHPSVVGYALRAFGIGPWVGEESTPVRNGSWGSVKALYP